MGRTSFKVAKDLVRDLREKQQLTQTEVAERIGIHLTRYQNIEWKGTTSPKTAQKLAALFGVTTDALQQGLELPDPGDYIRQIDHIIQERLASGENSNLAKAIQKICAETICIFGATKISHEEATRYLAEDIAQRIEAVQLVRNKNEIAALCELTGLSEEELLRPANVEGIWFVNIHRCEHQSEGFNAHSEVTQRADWAIGIVKDYVEKHLQNPCSDKSIHLTQDGFWYRIEISDPSRRRTVRIDLVRCLPDTKGLRWVKPSWRDEYLIREPLTYWARESFNFVCDFGEMQSPSGDIRKLRFLVTEYNQSSPGFSRPTGKMVISGSLGEMRDELIGSLRKEGSAHFLVQNWLTNDLKCTLAPLLNDYPHECWRLHGPIIDLDENKSTDRKRPFLERYLGTKYRIELVEQVGEDKFEPVPWREQDKKSLQESIQKMLDDPNDPAWTTGEPRRSFAPYSGEP